VDIVLIYRGKCPYCDWFYEGNDYDLVKYKLRKHLKDSHYDILLNYAMNDKRWKTFGKDYLIKWWAGTIASWSIKSQKC